MGDGVGLGEGVGDGFIVFGGGRANPCKVKQHTISRIMKHINNLLIMRISSWVFLLVNQENKVYIALLYVSGAEKVAVWKKEVRYSHMSENYQCLQFIISFGVIVCTPFCMLYEL